MHTNLDSSAYGALRNKMIRGLGFICLNMSHHHHHHIYSYICSLPPSLTLRVHRIALRHAPHLFHHRELHDQHQQPALDCIPPLSSLTNKVRTGKTFQQKKQRHHIHTTLQQHRIIGAIVSAKFKTNLLLYILLPTSL